MTKTLSKRTYEILMIMLTFVSGVLVGGIYGWILAYQQWQEALKGEQTQQLWDQYR